MYAQTRKAFAAAATWAVGTFVPALLTDGNITLGELLAVVLGTPIAGWVVYRVPNEPAGQ